MRRGLCRGSGRSGYYNVVPRDPYVHSLSAKGVKTYTSPERLVGVQNTMFAKYNSLYATAGITEEHKEEANEIKTELKNKGRWETFKERIKIGVSRLMQQGYSKEQAVKKYITDLKLHKNRYGLWNDFRLDTTIIALGTIGAIVFPVVGIPILSSVAPVVYGSMIGGGAIETAETLYHYKNKPKEINK